jgi:hypothetical protein
MASPAITRPIEGSEAGGVVGIGVADIDRDNLVTFKVERLRVNANVLFCRRDLIVCYRYII